jgi:hypothetical protein
MTGMLGVPGVGDEGVIIIAGARTGHMSIVSCLGGLDIISGCVCCRCKRLRLSSLKVTALEDMVSSQT